MVTPNEPDADATEPGGAAPDGTALLDIVEISKAFGGLIALSGVSVSVPPRAVFSIIGPNGSGKTTLLNIISGLLRPTSGQVNLRGRSIERMKPHDRARLGIARTFQHPRVFGGLTVLDNVRVGSHVVSDQGPRSAERRGRLDAEARRMLDIVQFPRRKEHVRVHSLSLREQRAVELARALMMRPQLLLMDEPVSGMDPAERPAWITYIREVQSSLGLTVILVEHSMKVVTEISDWVVVLSSGRMLAQGSADDVLSDPQVRSVYIGRGTKNA
jgi:ABC-type branched-subunit amino acid transport system ATPase component